MSGITHKRYNNSIDEVPQLVNLNDSKAIRVNSSDVKRSNLFDNDLLNDTGMTQHEKARMESAKKITKDIINDSEANFKYPSGYQQNINNLDDYNKKNNSNYISNNNSNYNANNNANYNSNNNSNYNANYNANYISNCNGNYNGNYNSNYYTNNYYNSPEYHAEIKRNREIVEKQKLLEQERIALIPLQKKINVKSYYENYIIQETQKLLDEVKNYFRENDDNNACSELKFNIDNKILDIAILDKKYNEIRDSVIEHNETIHFLKGEEFNRQKQILNNSLKEFRTMTDKLEKELFISVCDNN